MYLLYLTTVYFMRIANGNGNRAFSGPQRHAQRRTLARQSSLLPDPTRFATVLKGPRTS
ncbi:hypothetical protein FA13DRAFT_1804546 [Coprinellus micaceus]|uniref:Uncharacterized protein n=1 Tax=Coprinellus micaceus TaxID=71717 RepID=A0A4Y7S6B1_COPMI|nr:hypothetical protein FA13DRAFT_1804546 [Coprinellus micaceus]